MERQINYEMSIDADTVTLRILDYIGSGGVEFANVIQELEPHKGKKLNVLINSGGGSVFDGVAIYNYLKSSFSDIRTEVIGYGASIASIIFLAGSERVMKEGTLLFLHKPWTISIGNTEDLQKEIEALNAIEKELISIYVSNSNLSADQISQMLSDETWIGPDDAIKYGFATAIDKSTKANASIPAEFMANFLAKSKAKPVQDSAPITPNEQTTVVNRDVTESHNTTPVTPEVKETFMENTNVSANPEVTPVQMSADITKPVYTAQKFDKFRDYFKEVYNATLGNGASTTPKEIKEILDVAAEYNVMRDLATVYEISGTGAVPVPAIAASTWGTEGGSITAADSTVTGVSFDAYPLQGSFTVTDHLLEDSFYDVAKLIKQSVGGSLAEGELQAFLTGDGSSKPQGIFTKTADVTTATSGTITANEFVAFIDSLETKYRKGNEVILMNPKMLGVLRGLVDTSKKIEIDSNAQRINGIKYVLTSLAPAPAANTNVLVYGDLKRGYGIAQRGNGIVTKVVPGASALASTMLFAERVDGKIVDGNAFKVLKLKL